jgi:flagellin FlaB
MEGGKNKMIKKLLKIHHGQRGITGLETAIILIAFVVVAAVFAYTALSAGLFATQKSQEAVYSGLSETQSTLELKGSVIAYKGDANINSTVGKVEFTVGNAVKNGEAVDLTPPYELVGGALTASGDENPTQISFNDVNLTIADCAWTLGWVGKHDTDNLLDNNENAVITVWLHSYDGTDWAAGSTPPFMGSDNVDTYHTFSLEVKPAHGATLNIERTTPAYLETVMDLH